MKTAIIVTSLVGAGLEREARLLQDLLQSHQISSTLLHYTDINKYVAPADISISLEAIQPRVLSLATRNYFVPNSEWWVPANECYLPKFDKIFCKTRDCFDIWSRKIGKHRCVFTSWEAKDLYSPFPRENKFLHLAGRSGYKNTEAVYKAWVSTPSLPPLTIVCSCPDFQMYSRFHHSNIQWFQSVTEQDVVKLVNSHRFHIMPSLYEGFGHSLQEGLGCKAVVLTTDAPPMNEFDGICQDLTIPVSEKKSKALATLNYVYPEHVVEKVKLAASLSPEMCHRLGDAAREGFESNRAFFRAALIKAIE